MLSDAEVVRMMVPRCLFSSSERIYFKNESFGVGFKQRGLQREVPFLSVPTTERWPQQE